MKKLCCLFLAASALPLGGARRTENPADLVIDYAKFKEPPAEYRLRCQAQLMALFQSGRQLNGVDAYPTGVDPFPSGP